MRKIHNIKDEIVKQFNNEDYIKPSRAFKLLRLAQELNKTIYIFGSSSFGKTSLLATYFKNKNAIWVDAQLLTLEDVIELQAFSGKAIIFDNLHMLAFSADGAAIKEQISKLIIMKNNWIILSCRSKIPPWLLPAHIQESFLTISEQELALNEKEANELFKRKNVTFPKNQLKEFVELIHGNPVAIIITANNMKSSSVYDEKIYAKSLNEYWDYIEHNVYEHWSPELQEFVLKTCIVDSFNFELAKMITGRSDVERLIQALKELGNFLIITQAKDDNDSVYRYRNHMLESTRRWTQKKLSYQQRITLYNNAGLYYEMHDDVENALKMYEASNTRDRILSILVDNARKKPGVGNYYMLKKHYFSLTNEEIKSDPELMTGMCMLYSLILNPDESEKWYQELMAYSETQKGISKNHTKGLLLFLDLSLAHRGTIDMYSLLSNATSILSNKTFTLPELAVTANLPSIINGGKDFSEWTLKDREIINAIAPILDKTLGKYTKGIPNIALAECLFEKGDNSIEISSLIAAGRMQAESVGKIDLVFVADALNTWISIFDRNSSSAISILSSIRKKAIEEKAYKIIPNIDAFLTRVELYNGNIEYANAWLENTPDENVEFITFDRFIYLTKIRVYIANGQYGRSIELIQKMLYYCDIMHRTYIKIECMLLLAISKYLINDQDDAWKEIFCEAMRDIEKYHFIRLAAREGKIIIKLIEKSEYKFNNAEFLSQLSKECNAIGRYYPNYLGIEGDDINLSSNALMVLKLQAKGMSIPQIAKELSITIDTVKYHNKKTYEKLGIKNKAMAIIKAQELGLI